MNLINNCDELKLLKGMPIVLEPNLCLIFPQTLGEIASIGTDEYWRRINILTINDYEVKKFFEAMGIKECEISSFDFIIENCSASEEFYSDFKKAFFMVTREKCSLLYDKRAFLIGNVEDMRLLDKENFLQLQNIIRAQNNMEIEKPLTPFEQKMKEKFQRNKERVEKAKAKQNAYEPEDTISFSSLVSGLAAKGNGLNIFNIWDLTLYSFNDQLKRTQMIEEYENGLHFICAGADPKKMNLKHYMRNIVDKK